MEQDSSRRRAFWLFAGIFAAAACTAALILMFTGRGDRSTPVSPETAKAETAEDSMAERRELASGREKKPAGRKIQRQKRE